MADLTVAAIVPTGVAVTLSAATAGGDTVTPGARTFIEVNNAHTAAQRVVVDDPKTTGPPAAAAFDPDLSVSVPAGGRRMIGPINPERFARASDGKAALTYPDGVTALTIGAFSI